MAKKAPQKTGAQVMLSEKILKFLKALPAPDDALFNSAQCPNCGSKIGADGECTNLKKCGLNKEYRQTYMRIGFLSSLNAGMDFDWYELLLSIPRLLDDSFVKARTGMFTAADAKANTAKAVAEAVDEVRTEYEQKLVGMPDVEILRGLLREMHADSLTMRGMIEGALQMVGVDPTPLEETFEVVELEPVEQAAVEKTVAEIVIADEPEASEPDKDKAADSSVSSPVVRRREIAVKGDGKVENGKKPLIPMGGVTNFLTTLKNNTLFQTGPKRKHETPPAKK